MNQSLTFKSDANIKEKSNKLNESSLAFEILEINFNVSEKDGEIKVISFEELNNEDSKDELNDSEVKF